MKRSDLRKDYFWNTLGVFCQNAISPLLLIVITRVNGIGDSGLFSFAFSVSIIFWTIGMWGGRTYQVSDVKQRFLPHSYITVRLILSVVMLVGAILFSILNQYDSTKTVTILSLVLFKAIESIADSIYGILQINDRLYIAGKSLFYKSVGGLAVFIVIDLLTKDILLASVGIVLVNILMILFYDLRKTRAFSIAKTRAQDHARHIREAFVIMRRCLVIFAVSFLATLSLNIPRYFVDLYQPYEIGYFGIIAMPITLIILLVSFILQPSIVGLARLYGEGKYSEFNRTVRKIVTVSTLIGLIVSAIAYITGIPLLDAIFAVDFGNYRIALFVVLVGGTANAIVAIFINILTVMRRFRVQLYALLLTSILLVIASAILVGTQGLLAGVVLFACTAAVQAITLLIMYNRYIKEVGYV